jgi:hypothetical protein
MELAVKLNQSFDTLYELDFLEYSLLVSSIKRKIEEKNTEAQANESTTSVYFDNSKPINLQIPKDLKIR